MHKKTTATETPCGRFFIYIELNYSAFKVKRLKSTIFNSGSAAALSLIHTPSPRD